MYRNPAELTCLPLKDTAPVSLKTPSAIVSQVVLAYGVGMKVKISIEDSKEVQEYISKARSTGGSVSFFGFNIGLGGNANVENTSSTSFEEVTTSGPGTEVEIPPSDNSYPTLLAVIGTPI